MAVRFTKRVYRAARQRYIRAALGSGYEVPRDVELRGVVPPGASGLCHYEFWDNVHKAERVVERARREKGMWL